MSKKLPVLNTEKDFINAVYLPFISTDLKNPHYFGEEISSYQKDGIEYSINSFGYRGDEFIKNVDLLVMGCSNTFGYGIPEEHMWSNILKSNKIKTLNSIAMSGDSAQGQVIKFFQYIKKFGNPKNLVAIFPSYRAEFPLHDGKWEVPEKEKLYTLIDNNKASIVINSKEELNFEKYSSSPYDPNKMITKTMCAYYTHTFINILESYCQMTGINFRYSINEWDYRDLCKEGSEESLSSYMLKHSGNYFTWDYPLVESEISKEESDLECHSEYKNDKYFYRANDKNRSHWGLHQNIHIAEAVKKVIGF